ncbi:MAG: hypothetical protein PF961_21525 [Planctomycetota bacterium]|jgi:hypothetical protein|nr:hypothetical protein [Planctomycetota bacterium]
MRLTVIPALFLLTLGLSAAEPAADPAPEAKPTPYPLTTCIVSDEALDAMGKPVVKVHEGQEFKFCCKPCTKDFAKDPAAYVTKLDAAKKAAAAAATPAKADATAAPAKEHKH